MIRINKFNILLWTIFVVIILSINTFSFNETIGNQNVNLVVSASVSNVTKDATKSINYQEMEVKQDIEYVVEEQVIYVNATEEEKALLEDLEIANPKIPYTLGFVSESFTPTEKIDTKIYYYGLLIMYRVENLQ